MIKQFNPEKLYKTVNGHDVLIYNWDCGGKKPIHGAVKGSYNGVVWTPVQWTVDGRAHYAGFELTLNRKRK
jgi:hypothetical protein